MAFNSQGALGGAASGAVAGFADATGRFLPIVCTLNAAKVTDTVARLLGVDAAVLDELALAGPLGAGGLTLLPYLDGERTPNRPDATGTLAGIRTDVSREALALIREVCRENGAALLLVSHDEEVLRQFEDVRDFSELNRVQSSASS